jgi:hypothetical protein
LPSESTIVLGLSSATWVTENGLSSNTRRDAESVALTSLRVLPAQPSEKRRYALQATLNEKSRSNRQQSEKAKP